MRLMLLAAVGSVAVAILGAGPVRAQDWRGSHHHNRRVFTGRVDPCGTRSRLAHCNERRNSPLAAEWYGDDWAYANNQSWNSDSYNDWWHDEPSRAYPHWMAHNRDCARQWYAGDTLRC